ncbi:protoporphyrinogen oxidase HemJ [Pelagibacteraceae bacterium]|nr:protoporphyrinogen oxidase HemJ [Pelagibacteraceae bacterium]
MNFYLTFKALHLIAVISWMAGLLYLPRIFVYHVENQKDENQKETFKVMEKKLYNYIMMPAMILTWFFGLFLIHSLGFAIFLELWMQIKGLLILILTWFHFYLGSCIRSFANDKNNKSSKFYRIINEVPTILLIFIVFIVVFKPL